MDRNYIDSIIENIFSSIKGNYIGEDIALSDTVIGTKLFDKPIVGFADAHDPIFEQLREANIVGNHFMKPMDWLPSAKTVISFFLPFSKEVRMSNKKDMDWPSMEWMHGRIEGQELIRQMCFQLQQELNSKGFSCIIPSYDPRFSAKEVAFSSNWSERHVAYISGLGTFGLSKGLITTLGKAGRLGSVVTDLYIEPSDRKYKSPYDYCSMCGACAVNCPVDAITLEHGKNHKICSEFLNSTSKKHKPWYGCGKCQIAVPCETVNPVKFL